jgi:hypothetical protein
MEKSKKGRKQGKKAKKKRKDKWKGEHKSDDEAQKQRAVVVRQESRAAPESESHDMMRLLHNHINESHNRLHEHLRHMYELQSQMQEKIDYMLARVNHNEAFNCNASFGGSFALDLEDKQEEHDNSTNGSKVGNATKEMLKRGRGLPLRSNSNLSPSTPRRSKNQDKTSHKPRKRKQKAEFGYNKQFAEQKRGEPAAVNVGAHAGLINSNVNCYSNAILQCLASCICFTDFSPSEKHIEFTLNHAFASLMSSMVGSEESIDPSPFLSVFMPRFRPLVGEQEEVNIKEEGGMYYDCAWTKTKITFH